MPLVAFVAAVVLMSCSVADQGATDVPEVALKSASYDKNLVSDYGAVSNDGKDDTPALQRAIDQLTRKSGGGSLFIPQGVYEFGSVVLKSNVHIFIADGTRIIPTEPSTSKNYAVFYVGDDGPAVQNVSVKCVTNTGRYVIDFTKVANENVRAFQLKNVDGFDLSDFDVRDKLTKFSAITFGLAKDGSNYFCPRNGSVSRARIFNAHYGYGLVQMQVGKNITFTDLYGKGGATLRFETGDNNLNKIQPVGVRIENVRARKVRCVNGNAALMISPHTMKNGRVEVRNVKAVNCGFAVRIDKGFVTKEQKDLGLTPGSFEPSLIDGVVAIYGESAQLKIKHWAKYLPCELRSKVKLVIDVPKSDGKDIYSGPSIAPILYDAQGSDPGDYVVQIKNVSSQNFTYISKDIISEHDQVSCSN